MKHHQNLCSVAMAICLVVACSNPKKTEVQGKIIPVKVMEIAAMQTAGGRNYIGTVEESVAVSLSFSNVGTVEQVFVSEGQKVKKGQLLAALDATSAQNTYDAAQAKLVQAQDAYDRLAKVHENGSLPDLKFAEVEAGLQQAKSMAAVTKKSLDDSKLYAPRDGVIAIRSVEAGANAMPGIAAFKLVSVDKVNVKIPVPENEIGKIQEGQEASIVVPALDNAGFTGKVETKSVTANLLSHTYEVKIGVANVGTKNVSPLLPGMVCKVSLANDNAATAFVVPNRAIQISPDDRRFVWLVDGDVARRRFVKTGELANNGIVVAEGLSAGDKIIVEGFQKVSEGMKISITKL
jgi:RND family efflux transporter MFP subunit